MDFTDTINMFLIVVVCLLVHVEVGSSWPRLRPTPDSPVVSLQSYYRLQRPGCGGTLLTIDIGRSQAECNGRSTKHNNARFTIKAIGTNTTCIQFTDGNKVYSLKVFNGTRVIFEEHQCGTSSDDAFLFSQETNSEKFILYRHERTKLYLGVSRKCSDDSLSLIGKNGTNRQCFFKHL